jgi:hypothetical protein
MKSSVTRLLLSALMWGCAMAASAQQLDARFSCSAVRNLDGDNVTFADIGEIHLKGNQIGAFRWESSLFRHTHGFDCSIDESDDLKAETREDATKNSWRVSVKNGHEARGRRGYDYGIRFNCTIRLEREGDTLQIKPSCPALCGSRPNFSELSVDLKTGKCRYEE